MVFCLRYPACDACVPELVIMAPSDSAIMASATNTSMSVKPRQCRLLLTVIIIIYGMLTIHFPIDTVMIVDAEDDHVDGELRCDLAAG